LSKGETHIKEALLLRVADGDEKAFTQLLEAYSGLLYGFALRHGIARETAEELVQDIFTQVWQTRESLAEIRNFRTYLYVISRNRILNEVKKMIRERKRYQEWATSVITGGPETDGREKEEQLSLVDAAIHQLPPQQKKVWTLNRREGLTYPQIAAEMGISRETVKTYLQHANATITRYIVSRQQG
jgi:RNA polymerase sigma-70 factor (ECF subfamily)